MTTKSEAPDLTRSPERHYTPRRRSMALAVPIRERLGAAGHGLHVDRQEIAGGGVWYVGICSCGSWVDSSRFRALVVRAYRLHLVDAQRDPDGKHDELRRTLRALRGPLAPSTEGDPA